MGRPKLQPRGVAHGLSERRMREKKDFRCDQTDESHLNKVSEGSKVAQQLSHPGHLFIQVPVTAACDAGLTVWEAGTHTHTHTLFDRTKFQINLPETGNLWGWSYKGHQRLLSSCHIICVSVFLLKDCSVRTHRLFSITRKQKQSSAQK